MAVLREWKVDAVLERRRAHTSALLKTSLLGGAWPDTPEQGQVRGLAEQRLERAIELAR